MTVKQRDWLFIGLIVVILAVFFSISGKVKTTRVPYNDDHSRFFEIVAKDGKKAAEKFCGECHNDQGVQFPKDHPPKFRCLFCHKLEER